MKRISTYTIVALLAFGLGLGLAIRLDLFQSANAKKLWAEKNNVQRNPYAQLTRTTFVDLAKKLSPAVVNITVSRNTVRFQGHFTNPWRFRRRGPRRGLGTGFIINKNGMILTNNHVVENARSITVKLSNDTSYEAKVLGADPKTDIALIKINAKEPLTVAPLGSSKSLQIGEWVMAIGNPFGLSHTVTAGIVSAKGRRKVQPGNRQIYANFIQTDASINPGNSGGPLINTYGEVVGINTAINRSGQGLAFAIPIDMVKTLLPQLVKGRVKRSWIGVKIGPVSLKLAKTIGLKKPRGALVAEVVPSSPAERAGLQPGDVILGFAGKAINKHLELPWMASNFGIGKRVKLKVFRNGKILDKTLVMAEFPSQQRQTRFQPGPRGPRSPVPQMIVGFGMRVGPVTVGIQSRLRLPNLNGALVLDVDRGSPAYLANLRVSDVIIQINGKAVRGPQDVVRVASSTRSGQLIRLVIRRQGRKIFVAFSRN